MDTFTCLDDVKGRDRSDPRKLLAALDKAKKFSCFDIDLHGGMGRAMTWLMRESGWIKTTDLGYPWTGVEVTPEGRAALKSPEHWPGLTRKKPHN
jgi:hypothetical protein